MKILEEFKQFAIKGNVIDLAVGVIIGGAFGKIVTSLVNDVIIPPIGLILGGKNFNNLKWVMKGNASLNYGAFIQNIIDFLIVAGVIFLMIKLINMARKKEESKPVEPPLPTKEEKLLEEIRDILKNK